MKLETKLQFRKDWQKHAKIKHDDTLGTDHLDDMWHFAERGQNRYEGLAAYCCRFDESALARVARRAKMRALIEIEVPAPKYMGKVPSAAAAKVVKVPAYVGTGTRRTGAVLVPMMDKNGEVTDEGARLMLEQGLRQMKGWQNRFEAYLPEADRKRMRAFVNGLERAADKAAVRAVAA